MVSEYIYVRSIFIGHAGSDNSNYHRNQHQLDASVLTSNITHMPYAKNTYDRLVYYHMLLTFLHVSCVYVTFQLQTKLNLNNFNLFAYFDGCWTFLLEWNRLPFQITLGMYNKITCWPLDIENGKWSPVLENLRVK